MRFSEAIFDILLKLKLDKLVNFSKLLPYGAKHIYNFIIVFNVEILK